MMESIQPSSATYANPMEAAIIALSISNLARSCNLVLWTCRVVTRIWVLDWEYVNKWAVSLSLQHRCQQSNQVNHLNTTPIVQKWRLNQCRQVRSRYTLTMSLKILVKQSKNRTSTTLMLETAITRFLTMDNTNNLDLKQEPRFKLPKRGCNNCKINWIKWTKKMWH